MNKPTLVLLPGLDGTGDLFASLRSELPGDLKVITGAYPAHHFLPYPQLLAWLAGAVPKNEPYVLLGESYGSPLAVMFAATHPPNLVGLILCVGFISNPVRNWGFLPRLLARPLFFRHSPPDLALKYFIAGAKAPESLILAVNRATRSVNPEVLAARARAVIDCDATQEIRRVNVPLLFLQATEDRLVGKGCLEEIKRLHPETMTFAIRAPHLVLQREPQTAAKAIVEFLNTHCRPNDSGAGSSASVA